MKLMKTEIGKEFEQNGIHNADEYKIQKKSLQKRIHKKILISTQKRPDKYAQSPKFKHGIRLICQKN